MCHLSEGWSAKCSFCSRCNSNLPKPHGPGIISIISTSVKLQFQLRTAKGYAGSTSCVPKTLCNSHFAATFIEHRKIFTCRVFSHHLTSSVEEVHSGHRAAPQCTQTQVNTNLEPILFMCRLIISHCRHHIPQIPDLMRPLAILHCNVVEL